MTRISGGHGSSPNWGYRTELNPVRFGESDGQREANNAAAQQSQRH